MALPANRRQLFRQWVRQRLWHLAACVVAAVVIMSLFLLTHLNDAPVTGRTRLLVFSTQSYIDLAAVTSEMVRKEISFYLRDHYDWCQQRKVFHDLSCFIISTCWSLRTRWFLSVTLVTRWWKSWCCTCHKETRTSLKCLRSPGKSTWWKVPSSTHSACRSVIDLHF